MLPNQLLLSGSIRKMCCWFSLLLVAVVIYQNAFAQLLDENCKVKITYRVANGHTAITSQFMAALYNNSEFFCGGSLIHKRESFGVSAGNSY